MTNTVIIKFQLFIYLFFFLFLEKTVDKTDEDSQEITSKSEINLGSFKPKLVPGGNNK